MHSLSATVRTGAPETFAATPAANLVRLGRADTRPGLSEVVALVDLEDEAEIDPRSVLLDTFGGNPDPAKKSRTDSGPNEVDAQRLAAAAASKVRSGIIVIWTPRGEAHALSVGGGKACVFSRGAARARLPRGGPARFVAGPEPMSLRSGDTLMLCTREAAEVLKDREIEEAIAALQTPKATCNWLDALVRSRTQRAGSVCLAAVPKRKRLRLALPRVGGGRRPPRSAPEVEHPTKSVRRRILTPLAIAALLAAGVLVFHRFNSGADASQAQAKAFAAGAIPPHAAAPVALDVPSRLVSRQVSGMRVLLAWNAIPHATGYLVTIRRYTFRTPRPGILVIGGPRAAVTYSWHVRATGRSALGPVSRTGGFQVRPLPASRWTFRKLHAPAAQLSLAIRDSGSRSARATIAPASGRTGQTRTVTIQAGRTVALRLPLPGSRSALEGFSIRSSAPVLPTRTIRRHHAVATVYGVPGSGAWLAHW